MSLSERDTDLSALLDREAERQARCLSLIASENHASPAVREAMSSVLTDKYAEGYPGKRYYGGCEVADAVEELAARRAEILFGVQHANVQPHSGTQANLAAYMALLEPGDPIVAMALNAGGHLSHGFARNHSGRMFAARHYGVDPATGLIDYDEVQKLCEEHRPKVLVGGGSSYPRLIEWARMRAIADGVGASLLADIAHPAGLVAAGVIPSPVGQAQVVTMTTHKTLRGPRGGMILCIEDMAKAIDSSVFPGGQGGPFLHVIAAKAVAFGEALTQDFRAYGVRVVQNAKALAEALIGHGFEVVTGGTDTHMVVLDLRSRGISGRELEQRCFRAGLVVNKNLVPGDPRKPMETSGLRLGTPAVTTRGMTEPEMVEIAALIERLVGGGEGEVPAVRARVEDLAAAYRLP